MSHAPRTERRKAHRVDARLNINLHIDLPSSDEPAELETLNVSSSGVYFRSDRYIEPMTKLALSFDVPISDGESEAVEVNCEGIVARIVPELPSNDPGEYEVAVFFTTIDADSLRNLERYIDQRLRV